MPSKSSYPEAPSALIRRLRRVRLLALDVDGVFTDGRIYLGNQGEEYKAFCTLDGYGIKALAELGIQVAVITGRTSHIVQQRMQSLNVAHILQGQENKQAALQQLLAQTGIDPRDVASMGDDIPDLGMFSLSGVNFSVPNGHPLVRYQADHTTVARGGFGAVREVCDLLLHSRDKLAEYQGSSE